MFAVERESYVVSNLSQTAGGVFISSLVVFGPNKRFAKF